MNRPRYETEKDLEREQGIAYALCKTWGVELHKLPVHQHLDYAATRDGDTVKGLIEIKWRSFVWGDYPDVMLSASKVLKAREFWEAFVVPTAFVVSDRTGDIRYCDLYNDKRTLYIGGRTLKTRDSDDIEAIVRIPNADFKPLVSDTPK